jgi:flagellar biosynthetic protein FliR
MDAVPAALLAQLSALWWPFCRVMAMLSAAPVLGDGSVPVPVRALVSLVLAVILLPVAAPAVPIEPLSLHAVVATVEQAVVGGVMGLALHFTTSAVLVLGYLVSSQMGLSMAVMNDPMSGVSSDVVSSLLSILCILVFFSIDGHLIVVQVAGASFQQWPVGSGLRAPALQAVVFNVAWVFSAALLLALPIVFATLVVQLGFGFLARVAPTLNLFALGFSVVTIFGVFMLSQLVRFVPEHYLRMSAKVLEMLRLTMVTRS